MRIRIKTKRADPFNHLGNFYISSSKFCYIFVQCLHTRFYLSCKTHNIDWTFLHRWLFFFLPFESCFCLYFISFQFKSLGSKMSFSASKTLSRDLLVNIFFSSMSLTWWPDFSPKPEWTSKPTLLQMAFNWKFHQTMIWWFQTENLKFLFHLHQIWFEIASLYGCILILESHFQLSVNSKSFE